MNIQKMRPFFTKSLIAFLFCGAAHAELLEYSFMSVDGKQRTLSPSEMYANPSGLITFSISAGIDRKVRVSILKKDGTVVSIVKSGLLGASDRITVGGKDYYGAKLQLPTPAEGEYKLKAEILSSQDSPIQEEKYDFVVDVTKPVIGDFSWGMKYGGGLAPDGNPIFSTTEALHISLNDISDSLSGIQDVTYKTFWVDGDKDGEIYTSGEVAYYKDTNKAMIGSGSTNSGASAAFPKNVQSKNRIVFYVKDVAGNEVSKELFFYNNSSCGGITPELVAIEDPTYQGSFLNIDSLRGLRNVEGENKVNINKNPVKAIYRVPKTAYRYLPEGAIFGGYPAGTLTNHGLVYSDSKDAYFMIEAALGLDGTFNWTSAGWTNNSTFRCSPLSVNNPVFTDETMPPKWVSIEAYIDGVGWVGSHYGVPGTTPKPPRDTKISKIKATLETRTYSQTVYTAYGSCDVPPGETACVFDTSIDFNKTGTAGYYHNRPYAAHSKNRNFKSSTVHTWEWDASDPYIEDLISHDSINKTVEFSAIEKYSGYVWNRVKLKKAGIFVKRDDDIVEIIDALKIDTSGDESIVYASYKSIGEGEYDIYAWVEDNYGNKNDKKLFSIVNDTTPPEINISLKDENIVSSLDDIEISVIDSMTDKPKITSVNLTGGPASEDVYLALRELSENTYKLEYPVMFPSLKEGESYTLSVEATDDHKNTAKTSVQFYYSPRQITLAEGMDGKILIPAVTHEFIHADGKQIIETEPLTLSDGSLVSGSYDVFATLRSDAKVPLVVNGVRIEAGETMGIMNQHDFSTSNGRLSIPVKPAVPDVVGSSSLLVMTSAPNSPVLVVDINTWKGTASLSSDSWTVRQVIDPVKIYAQPDIGVPCRFTTNEEEAMGADAIQDPVCLLQWDRIPDEIEQVAQDNKDVQIVGLEGQAVNIGEHSIEYSLYLFSGDGSKVKVGSGSHNLTVTSAYGSVSYSPIDDIAQVNRIIEDFEVELQQSKGPDCSLTLIADRAKVAAASRSIGSVSQTCFFEWQQIPDGLVQNPYWELPSLSGSLANNGDHELSWRVSIFTRNGTRVTLNEERFNIEAVDPPAPTVELSSEYSFKDNIYLVPMKGNYLGDAVIRSETADLDITISRNSDVLESETFSPRWGTINEVYRRINTDERDLWEETIYKVSAAYNKVPDVKTESVYRAISVPSERIKPIIEVESDTAINTKALPVRVLIRDQFSPDDGYDANTMGVWRVRLIQQKPYNETVALTDYMEATNGEAEFSVDLSGMDTSYIRIVAEAMLESPIEGYKRIEQSIRPAFLTILRGGAIDAEVQARKLSGEAPFTAVFKLSLNDRQDLQATGQIVWETSRDEGKTWDQYIPEDRYKYQLVKTFDKGEYQVRAKVVNVNSGVETYTESVQVVAYEKPDISIVGPTTLFVGSEGSYTASLTLNGENISGDNTVIEWSTDGGKTYSETANSFTLSSDEEARYRLWARVRSAAAPADDSYAYEIAKTAVDFRVVKAPRPYVTGPRIVETGKTYVFKATSSLPYRGMDVKVNGFFTLPDGSIVQGDTAEYVPSEADLNQERVETTYTSWIEGYRDQGAEASYTLRSRVWQYVWPTFGMQVRKTADVAPATITASVRAIAFSGQLEEPTYEWELPDGAVILTDRQDTTRSFMINEPGDYTIKVTVRDARGHEAIIEQSLNIGQAEPYVIDLKYSGSNKYEREPLDVLLRPYISGGHPRDRIATRTYSINGTPLESSGYYGRATLDAGEHNIKLKIISEMGNEAEGEVNINVAENMLPVCSLSSRETVGSWIVYAKCEDTDGRVKSYEWTLNGKLQSISSDRINISKGTYETMPTITLVGIDDSGGRSEAVTMN